MKPNFLSLWDYCTLDEMTLFLAEPSQYVLFCNCANSFLHFVSGTVPCLYTVITSLNHRFCGFSKLIVRLKVFLFVLVQVFMQSNFALEDPEIFNHVLPWNMVTQETKEGMREAPRNSAKLLQEKV